MYHLGNETAPDLAEVNDLDFLDNVSNPNVFNNPRSKDNILGVFEVEFQPLIEELINSLRGCYYDAKEKKYFAHPSTSRIINERGINDLQTVLMAHLNKGVALSKLTEKEIGEIMLSLCIKLADLLHNNMEYYEIRGAAEMSLIFHNVEVLSKSVLNQSLNGWAAENRIKNISVSQAHSQQQLQNTQAKRRSFLGSFLGGGK